METPLLTLGIPTFNRCPWLKACLEASIPQVEALPEGTVEIVVVENAGEDGAWAMLQELAARHACLRISRNAENVGPENFNVVVRAARGRYVWFMGDDDAPLPGGVARVLDLIRSRPRDLYLLHSMEVDVEGKPILKRDWFVDLPRLDWDLSDRNALKEYCDHAQYMAGVFGFISVLVFDRQAWLDAGPYLLEFGQLGWPHVARVLQMVQTRGRVLVVEEALLQNTAGNDGFEERDPWGRAKWDLWGWVHLAEEFFPDDRELRLAFLGPLRRNRQNYLIRHLRNHSPSREAWEDSLQLMHRAGISPVAINAYELGLKIMKYDYREPAQLDPESLCLADMGFIARGSRKVLVMTPRLPGEDLTRLVGALRTQTLAEIRMLGTAGSPAMALADGKRITWQTVDLVKVSGDPAYRAQQCRLAQASAPDLVVNADPERRPGWDILTQAAGGLAALAFQAPERPVPADLAAWLDSGYSRLAARGPMTGLVAALGLVLPAQAPPPAGSPARSRLGVRWEGSQFVHHSLAHVNRQLCLGLLRDPGVELSLVPYEPDRFDGAKVPAFRSLAARVDQRLAGPAAVHVRHQWPPQFQPPAQGAWVMIQPWEFGGIPAEWVAPMRDQVDEIWVPSAWLKDCYVRSGIPADKVVVVPNGVDCEVFRPAGGRFPLKSAKGCKFLFLGGTIHRKGFDLLLDTYVRTFRAADDVCLVVKEQGGGVYGTPGLPEYLRKLRAEDPTAPEIEYRTDDLTEPQVASLYRACDVLVLPYRGEGFGLPIAEAMACGLPVLVTARGGAQDFAREPWAYLIPSRTVPIPAPGGFTPSRAGFWLEEPDGAVLADLMRRAAADPAERRRMGALGRAHAEAELGWDRPVALVHERLEELAGRTPRRFAPPEADPPRPEAFLYRPDWTGLEWMEVLLSFLLAFKPGEPVTLVLPWSGTPGEPALKEIQLKVLELAKGAGLQTFPDVALVDQPGDLPEFLAGFSVVTQVPRGRGAVAGLLGAHGLRLAAIRSRLGEAR